MIQWWRDLSVSKKLYAVVGIMALLIATELFSLYFAINTLSAVRAFVGGEALWSKAQKTAVFQLQKYAVTRNVRYYELFQNQLRIPLGDRQARIELEKEVFDRQKVIESFTAGQIHPDDMDAMISLARRFYQVPHLARAFDRWRIGDGLITKLIEEGERLHQLVQGKDPDKEEKIEELMDQIFVLDDQLTVAENDFSYALGDASRWLESLLIVLLLLAVVTVEGTGLFLTVSFARGLTNSLNELNQAANLVGQGDFQQRVAVRSRDELGQLAESINLMTENLHRKTQEIRSAERASETKNLFLANMSHEIRTPLNAILGFSEILSDAQINEADRKHYASIIKRTGNSLISIINDILDVSKIEAQQVEVELRPFSLPQLISDIQEVLKFRCEERNVQLSFQMIGEVAPVILSDAVRLRQILINIIGNSIKFTENGKVEVRYRAENDLLNFEVSDTGVGISPEHVEKLFKPFSQGDDSVQKKFGGTGLGLLISQRLARLLGGNVVLIESQKGAGSKFLIQVKYEPSNQGLVPRKASDVSALDQNLFTGKRILVVEDSTDNQLLARVYLTRRGAEVEFANNGQEGVDKALSQAYDLILMDIQMPVMDGYTAVKTLRAKNYQGPIVAFTGYAMKEDQRRCIEVGCDDYLSKPFDRKTLVECVAKYIG